MNTLLSLLGTRRISVEHHITYQLEYQRTRQFLLVFQAALGDLVTIWRCYIVYGKKIVAVLLPVLTALASFALGIDLSDAGIDAFGRDGIDDAAAPLVIWDNKSWAWAGITIICTVYCMGSSPSSFYANCRPYHSPVAISVKIYSSARLTKSSRLFAVIFFIIETSFIYTLGVILYLLAASGVFDVVIDIQTVLMGAIVQLPVRPSTKVFESNDGVGTLPTPRTQQGEQEGSQGACRRVRGVPTESSEA
ncbi:hypothetical protein DENSPDRAFT_427334 [Dentipellis sp. KUC8613]|nr:hypothetical protein DENSPDRAFT_427334 [Dentipellis sp. KUC8613]